MKGRASGVHGASDVADELETARDLEHGEVNDSAPAETAPLDPTCRFCGASLSKAYGETNPWVAAEMMDIICSKSAYVDANGVLSYKLHDPTAALGEEGADD